MGKAGSGMCCPNAYKVKVSILFSHVAVDSCVLLIYPPAWKGLWCMQGGLPSSARRLAPHSLRTAHFYVHAGQERVRGGTSIISCQCVFLLLLKGIKRDKVLGRLQCEVYRVICPALEKMTKIMNFSEAKEDFRQKVTPIGPPQQRASGFQRSVTYLGGSHPADDCSWQCCWSTMTSLLQITCF